MSTDAGNAPLLRDARADDFAAILALNAASVWALSPLAPAQLQALHAQCWHHRVAERGAAVAAFLLALRPGAAYESPNYRWFCSRYAEFVYVDRIVVDAAARRDGLATLLYADLIARARAAGLPCVTCEFDIDPPNAASQRFHARLGFREVGTQAVAGGSKRVSLQVLAL